MTKSEDEVSCSHLAQERVDLGFERLYSLVNLRIEEHAASGAHVPDGYLAKTSETRRLKERAYEKQSVAGHRPETGTSS
eukprot:4961397-Pleurochrysis_carterae.AAC.1